MDRDHCVCCVEDDAKGEGGGGADRPWTGWVGFWFSRTDEVWESMDGFDAPLLLFIYNRGGKGNFSSSPLFFLSSLIAGWMDVVRPSLPPLSLSRSPLELPVV